MNLPRLLIAYKYVIRCIENFSIAIVYGLYYFGKGHLSQENYALYIRYDSLAQVYQLRVVSHLSERERLLKINKLCSSIVRLFYYYSNCHCHLSLIRLSNLGLFKCDATVFNVESSDLRFVCPQLCQISKLVRQVL